MRKASLLVLTSLILIAVGMLASTLLMAQWQRGATAKFGIKLPDGSTFMNVTTDQYDIGDKFNITVHIQDVVEMMTFGVTLVWNTTFTNATGRYWKSPAMNAELTGGRWTFFPPAISNDYLPDVVPLVGVFEGFGGMAFGATYALNGSYNLCIIEFQVNAYGPLGFYLWKDPTFYKPWPYTTGQPELAFEGLIPEAMHPVGGYCVWSSHGIDQPYDIVWAPGYTDVANAVLYVNPPPVIPIIESCDSTGVIKDLFNLSETVYVNGSGYSPSTTFDIYIVDDVTSWSDGMTIPTRVSGTNTTVSSNSTGDIPPTEVWSPDLTLGEYDIVVDVNNNSKYDVDIDALDDMDIEETAGFSVIPEFPSVIILPLFLTATIIAVVVAKTVWSKRPRGRIDVK